MSVWTLARRGGRNPVDVRAVLERQGVRNICVDTDEGFTDPFLPLTHSEVISICEQRIINGEPGMIPDLTQLRETDLFGRFYLKKPNHKAAKQILNFPFLILN